MEKDVALEIVKTVGIVATAIVSTIGLIWGARMRNEQKELKIMVDGRLTDLMKANEIKDHALGKEAGKQEQKAESKADAAEQKTEAINAPPVELKIAKMEVEIKQPIPPLPPTEETPTKKK